MSGLRDRLNGAPDERPTLTWARSIGWHVSMSKTRDSNGRETRQWRAHCTRLGRRGLDRTFATCDAALNWIAMCEKGDILR